MGTWGVGAFENDGASDWAMELEEASSPAAAVKRALSRVAKNAPRRGTAQRSGAPRRLPPKPVDLDDALEALAAAEIVAAARGHASPKLLDDVSAWVTQSGFVPSPELTTAAIVAVKCIAAHSELKSEWNGDKSWQREQVNLIQRLRKPDKPLASPPITKPASDVDVNPVERALKKLKLHIHVNADGSAREVVPTDTPRLTDADMPLLASLPTLEGLHLGDSKITDAGVEHLRGLKNLSWVWLRDTPIGDAAAEILSTLPLLRDLDLSGTRLTDRGVKHLARLTQLERLDLSETAITDAGLTHLGGLKRLRALRLTKTKVTGSGLAKFPVNLPLEELVLAGTRATNASMRQVARFKKLKKLFVPKRLAPIVERLRKELPNTEITAIY